MPGLNRDTGRALDGWEHVLQSLDVLFSTRFHERVMRRYFGSFVPHMLGENLVQRTVTRFFWACGYAIVLWEPRFALTRVQILDASRKGNLAFLLEGVYFPNGHLDDRRSGQRKTMVLIASESRVVLREQFESGSAA